tara:strand:+ start:157 stop:513 length:357 start_codon:yes stop_codon:yes gene_type:complete
MSTLKVDTLQTTGGAGLYPARAWLNYNQVVVGITNSANVSSVTDVAAGQFTVSFTNAFTANTYCAGSVGFKSVGSAYVRDIYMDGDDTQSTSSSQVRSESTNGSNPSDVESNKISWTL